MDEELRKKQAVSSFFRTFVEGWVWLVKQRAEEGPRGAEMEPTREAGVRQGEVQKGLEGPQGEKRLSQVIRIDEGKIEEHLREVGERYVKHILF